MADNYTYKDGGGLVLTHASKELSAGVHASKHIEIDDAGNPIYKAEDAAHSSGDKGIMALAVRKDTAAALAGTDGDYIPLIVDAEGRLHVTSTAQAAAGDIAHDSADSGNPVKFGGKAASSAPGAVTAGDRVNAWFDLNGRLVVNLAGIVATAQASAANSLPVVLASDQSEADNGTLATSALGMSAYYQDLTNSAASGMAATKGGRVRMTGQRELLVAPRARWGFGDATDVSKIADLTGSTTNAYSSFTALTTAFLDGSDVGFGSSARWIRVPMLEFVRGATIGLYQNLGVNITVNLRADLTGNNSSATVQRPVIDTVTVASGGFVWFAAFPLAEGANASMRYVPMLNMPMAYAVLEITPASDPSSGGLILAVAR